MKIQVLYFAVFRERLGRDEEALELGDGARVADAIEALAARYPAVRALRGKFRVAVNQDFSDDDHALADGDEIALIPPVAGGAEAADGAGAAERHARLLGEPLSLDRCIAAVSGPGMGGIVTFVGMVRRHSRGTVVDHLEYEAYGPMAVRELVRLCDEIEAEIAGVKLAVEHRVGRLAIGDVAVAIAAAAPHRAEAFTACRAMIDRLKDRVPIWKKEVGEDGAEWVGLGP
jgi:molybdopterin synthase catalytic subunit